MIETNRKMREISLVLIYVGSLANIIYPVLRFENRRLSLMYTAIVMIIPLYLAMRSLVITKRILRVFSVFFTWSLSIASIMILIVLFINIGILDDSGHDPSFEWCK